MAKKSFNIRKTKGLGNLQTVLSPENITILPELQSLIPEPTADERMLLRESIEEEGVKEKLELWEYEGQSILVDGHNRLQILKELNKTSVPHIFKDFDSLEAVKEYMLRKQLGRRNLSDANRIYLIGLLYNDQKGRQGGATENKENVAQNLASSNAISERSVRNAGNYAKGVDKLNPDDKRAVLTGNVKVPKSDLEQIGKDSTIVEPISVDEAKEKAQKVRKKKAPQPPQSPAPSLPSVMETDEPAGKELKQHLIRDLEFIKEKYGDELFFETIMNYSER